MPKYRFQGKFKCAQCKKFTIKKGTCRPKECGACGAEKESLTLVEKKEL